MIEDVFYPQEMKDRRKWVLWRLVEQDGKTKKMPYRIDGKWASSTSPKTWSDYETAQRILKNSHGYYRGIGYMMDGNEVFIDLDHCLTDGNKITSFAKNIIDNFDDTYIERSQSGTGLHIFCKGSIPTGVKTEKAEMYCNSRFCAMTGNAVNKNGLMEKQKEINVLYDFLTKDRRPEPQEHRRPLPLIHTTLSAQEVIEMASSSKGGDIFKLLFAGDWRGLGIGDNTQSSADLAFCNRLAFWTGGDTSLMEEIFRASGLFRNERKMMLAVSKAAAGCNSYYQRR